MLTTTSTSKGCWPVEPKPEDYEYELDQVLSAMVGIKAIAPADAFTAETLGTERTGQGVLIDKAGTILTIGYLITEAETVWITLHGGRVVPGHVLGYDQETGFGLVQALARLDLPHIRIGSSARAVSGEQVVVAAAGGRLRAIAGRIVGKHEFAGYWEYVVDEAIFTAPAHPTWSGTALIGPAGELMGIGSLQLQQQARSGGAPVDVNMMVPIDLLKPILEDLRTLGRRRDPPRPWLGLYATEMKDKIVIAGVSGRGPARRADVRPGDVVVSVGGHEIRSLAQLFRKIWSLGQAGVEVPMALDRNGDAFDVRVKSVDRSRLLKGPILH